MNVQLIVVALAAVVGGCRGSSGVPSSQRCSADADALRGLLMQAAAEPPTQFLVEDEQLVRRADLPRREQPHAPVVTLTPAGARYQGRARSTDELRETLTRARREIAEALEMGRTEPAQVPEPRRVRFVIDARTPWSTVVEAVDAAIDAELTALGFVFAVPPAAEPPPRTDVEAQLEALPLDANDRVREVAKITRRPLEGCRPALDVFEQKGDENLALAIAERVPEALVSCGCRVDMARVRSALFHLIWEPRPTRALDLDPAAPAETIELPAATPWSEAAATLTPATQNVRLAVLGAPRPAPTKGRLGVDCAVVTKVVAALRKDPALGALRGRKRGRDAHDAKVRIVADRAASIERVDDGMAYVVHLDSAPYDEDAAETPEDRALSVQARALGEEVATCLPGWEVLRRPRDGAVSAMPPPGADEGTAVSSSVTVSEDGARQTVTLMIFR